MHGAHVTRTAVLRLRSAVIARRKRLSRARKSPLHETKFKNEDEAHVERAVLPKQVIAIQFI
jgi:hypothetical protein